MNFELSPTALGLAVAGWALQLSQPRTPLGRFPSAATFYLLLILMVAPLAGALAAMLGILLAIGLKQDDWRSELNLSLLPILLSAAISSYPLAEQPLPLRTAACGLVYLLVLNLAAGRQAAQRGLAVPWVEIRWAFLRASVALPLLSAIGLILLPAHLAWLMVLLILAWFLAGGAVTELVQGELEPVKGKLRSTREREQRWVARLKTLESLSKRLTRSNDLAAAKYAISETVEEYCAPESVAIHLAWGHREPLKRQPDCSYYSMSEAGWLEVKGVTSQEQAGLLTTLATTAGFALREVKGRQDRLHAVTKERDQMESWLARLRVLLEASQSLASGLSIGDVLDAVGPVLHRMVRHQDQAVICYEPLSQRVSEGFQGLEEILAATRRDRSGLLQRELIAVPVVYEGRALGALILRASQALEPVDLELVKILAYQLGGAFERARLYQGIRSAESQVVQSSKMAAVGQLAAGIAHELNTPLGTILMAVESAEKTMLQKPELAQKRLQLAVKAGQKARSIISKLLHYSREATLEAQTVDLAAVVHDAEELLTHHLQKAGVHLLKDLGPVATVQGNENELHQVLSNLILNACEAISSGDYPREIKISLGAKDGMVQLSVSDEGPGIAPEVLPRIFEPFFTTRAMGDGTGLGLSVSQQIVEKHSGKLEVNSQPGHTVFTLTLPVNQITI